MKKEYRDPRDSRHVKWNRPEGSIRIPAVEKHPKYWMTPLIILVFMAVGLFYISSLRDSPLSEDARPVFYYTGTVTKDLGQGAYMVKLQNVKWPKGEVMANLKPDTFIDIPIGTEVQLMIVMSHGLTTIHEAWINRVYWKESVNEQPHNN